MSYFELSQENPALFFAFLLISLGLTASVYGAFPLIFAITRKKPITKKKYKKFCYGINIFGMVYFVVLNGAASGAPYLLWTWVFSKFGVKKLEANGLLLEVNSTAIKQNTCDFCLQRTKNLKSYKKINEDGEEVEHTLCEKCAKNNGYL